MLLYFIAAQGVAILIAVALFRLRRRRWSFRHTVLATVIPCIIFLLWMCFWCWVPLGDLAPTPVLQELLDCRPSTSALVWMCLPPILLAWLFFLRFSTSHPRHDPPA